MIHPAWWFLLGAWTAFVLRRDQTKTFAEDLRTVVDDLAAVLGILLLSAVALAAVAMFVLIATQAIWDWPRDVADVTGEQGWYAGLVIVTIVLAASQRRTR